MRWDWVATLGLTGLLLGCSGDGDGASADASPRDAAAQPDAGVAERGARPGSLPKTEWDDAGVSSMRPQPQAGLHVVLPDGALAGKQVGAVRMFLGIAFAQPPVGPLRFAPARPVEPWSGTRDAKQFGPACPQPKNGLAAPEPYSEDCLTLDVYTPATVDAPLPVMVFIHGGAFVNGASSQYDPRALMSQTPLVVVTLNYRLGALGFLSHPDLDAERPQAPSGSDGIRDQQLALRWVYDNVSAFGGDPDNITVFGESAGAISACIHWLSPGSRGLARRYILESGTCTSDGPGVRDKASADALGRQLSDALCGDQADVIGCLRDAPVDTLVNWGADMGLFGPAWYPTVEGPNGVLPQTPERLIYAAHSLAPLIVGTNKNEWALFEQLGAQAPSSVEALDDAIASSFGAKSADVAAQYSAASDDEANAVYVRMISDMSFRCPTRTLAQLAVAKGAHVWQYSFEQGSAFHAQELDYVFGGSALSDRFGDAQPSAALTALVQRYWTRFAVDGDPNGGSDPGWPQFTTADDAYLVLVDPPVASSGLSRAACDFWRAYWRDGGTVELH